MTPRKARRLRLCLFQVGYTTFWLSAQRQLGLCFERTCGEPCYSDFIKLDLRRTNLRATYLITVPAVRTDAEEAENAWLMHDIQGLVQTIKELRFLYQGSRANASFAELDAKIAAGREDTQFLQTALSECQGHVADLRSYLGYTKETENSCRLHREQGMLVSCDNETQCIYGCGPGGGRPLGECTCDGILVKTCACRQ